MACPTHVGWIYEAYTGMFARDVGASESLRAHGLDQVAVELARLGFGNVGKHLRDMGVSVKHDLWA